MIEVAKLNLHRENIDKVLKNIIVEISDKDLLIKEIVSYVMFPTGKLLRPLLTFYIYKMLDGIYGDIYKCACVTEMIHAATLILDDLPCMDNSDYRRKKLSCHKKFGDANSILIAFGLSGEALNILSDKNNFDGISDNSLLIMLNEVCKKIGFSGLIGGQVADLNMATSLSFKSSDDKKLDYITKNKTAVLFEICALISCCLANASEIDKENLLIYTYNIGLALQIFDDLNDIDEDKGLSFVKIYGEQKSKEMLSEKINICSQSITYTNEYALLLKRLPNFLLGAL